MHCLLAARAVATGDHPGSQCPETHTDILHTHIRTHGPHTCSRSSVTQTVTWTVCNLKTKVVPNLLTRSWSWFLGSQPAGDLVINPEVDCLYFPPDRSYFPRKRDHPLGRYQIILLAGQRTCDSRSRVRVLAEDHCVVALGKLLTPVCLCQQVCN